MVIAKTDPPLLSVAVAPTARRRRARLVNWLQDIYPETTAVLGVPLVRGPIAEALAALRNRSLRNAEATVVAGALMADRIKALGVPPARVHVIANWCDDEVIRPLQPANNPLREAWHLAGKFVVGYSGNLGRAHEFETMLAAAAQLRNEPRIVFLVIGGGKQFEAMAKAVKAHGLERTFRFRTYQERAMLPHSLTVSDVHWLSLDPELEGLIVPSKFYGIAAAGRPIVMIGDQQGEIGRLVRHMLPQSYPNYKRCIGARNAMRFVGPLRAGIENPQHRFKHTPRRNRLAARTPVRNVLFRKCVPHCSSVSRIIPHL
jgi:colanic acid biosynthesis glycosyl transferase WcaI